jgi:hypothetical protein
MPLSLQIILTGKLLFIAAVITLSGVKEHLPEVKLFSNTLTSILGSVFVLSLLLIFGGALFGIWVEL